MFGVGEEEEERGEGLCWKMELVVPLSLPLPSIRVGTFCLSSILSALAWLGCVWVGPRPFNSGKATAKRCNSILCEAEEWPLKAASKARA